MASISFCVEVGGRSTRNGQSQNRSEQSFTRQKQHPICQNSQALEKVSDTGYLKDAPNAVGMILLGSYG